MALIRSVTVGFLSAPTPPTDPGGGSTTPPTLLERVRYPMLADWPDQFNTGVTPGTTLTPYTGPMTITVAGTVIDSKTITGELRIYAKNVVIRNCKINGSIYNDETWTNTSWKAEFCEIDLGTGSVGIANRDYELYRCWIHGGRRHVYGYDNVYVQDCFADDNYIDQTTDVHASSFRMNQNCTYIHNKFGCDKPDNTVGGGCSASLTGYGDWNPITNNLIYNNFIMGTYGGFSAYGGSSQGKPFPNASNVDFIDNTFGRGPLGTGGVWGPITAFDVNAPGNEWTNNNWDTGEPVPPAF